MSVLFVRPSIHPAFTVSFVVTVAARRHGERLRTGLVILDFSFFLETREELAYLFARQPRFLVLARITGWVGSFPLSFSVHSLHSLHSPSSVTAVAIQYPLLLFPFFPILSFSFIMALVNVVNMVRTVLYYRLLDRRQNRGVFDEQLAARSTAGQCMHNN